MKNNSHAVVMLSA